MVFASGVFASFFFPLFLTVQPTLDYQLNLHPPLRFFFRFLFFFLQLDPRDALTWWASTGKVRFPFLASVAQQAFGNQTAAAQVERDFSACGNLLGLRRSRVDTYWVEMIMFLKANYDLIPESTSIPMIATSDIRSCIPARFRGEDADLLAAEAAFDALDNMQKPTLDQFDLDDR